MVIQQIQNILQLLKNGKLNPNQAFLLFLLYSKEYSRIKEIFGVEEAIKIRNSLVESPYILSDTTTKFMETIISKNEIEKLLGIKSDNINFWEFYNCYPVKVGNRILRASGQESQLALKHKKQYLAKVKTINKHEEAIKAISAFVSKQKNTNNLQYLPAMDRIMNNALWESWIEFTKEEQTKNWNYDDA